MTINMLWFQDQVRAYTAKQRSYKKYAEVLESVLTHVARQICPTALVQARAKSIPSFAEKILRKRDKYPDPVNQLTDLCGARVIAHVKADVEAVCRFIREHFVIDEANSLDSLSRLHASEFGYRSVHYVVQFKPRTFPLPKIPVQIPDDVYPLKAEIQVRTIAQHAWADIGHDRLYKSSFVVPEQLVRESARLESADEAFSRLTEGVDAYRADYGRHVDEQALRQEVDLLQAVRKYSPQDEKLAHQIARLLISLQDWRAVIGLEKEFPDSQDAGLLSCLGYALCQLNKNDRKGSGYLKGRDFLERATTADPRRVEAHVRLAETWIDEKNPKKVLHHYEQAFGRDPTDPQVLSGYVKYKIAGERSLAFLTLLKPSIVTAIEKCRAQADAGVNLPWALYHIGELSLLMGTEHELPSLNAYIQAAASSPAAFLLEEAQEGLQMFEPVERDLPAVEAARRLLLLAQAAKLHKELRGGTARLTNPEMKPEDRAALQGKLHQLHEDLDGIIKQIAALATPSAAPIAPPVVIVAGGCDPAFQSQMEKYGKLLQTAFASYRGTIISGGTKGGSAAWSGS